MENFWEQIASKSLWVLVGIVGFAAKVIYDKGSDLSEKQNYLEKELTKINVTQDSILKHLDSVQHDVRNIRSILTPHITSALEQTFKKR